MSNYEKQIQTTGQCSDQKMSKVAHNGGGIHSSAVPGSDLREGEWADVLRELREASEAYY